AFACSVVISYSSSIGAPSFFVRVADVFHRTQDFQRLSAMGATHRADGLCAECVVTGGLSRVERFPAKRANATPNAPRFFRCLSCRRCWPTRGLCRFFLFFRVIFPGVRVRRVLRALLAVSGHFCFRLVVPFDFRRLHRGRYAMRRRRWCLLPLPEGFGG